MSPSSVFDRVSIPEFDSGLSFGIPSPFGALNPGPESAAVESVRRPLGKRPKGRVDHSGVDLISCWTCTENRREKERYLTSSTIGDRRIFFYTSITLAVELSPSFVRP